MKQHINNFHFMSMFDFLYSYVAPEIEDGSLTTEIICELERNKATHIDLSLLNISYLKRISFEDVLIDDLYKGNVLLVTDFKSKNRPAPYIRPSLVKSEERGRK